MANVRAAIYLTVTLLKWCHSEIVNTAPESWYSANVIKDGTFSPKSLSEIFSTEDTFSTINPIIVLPTSRSPPLTSPQTSLDPFAGSVLPSSIFSKDPTTLQTNPTTLSLTSVQTIPTTPSPLPPIQAFPPSSPLYSSSISTFSPTTSTLAPTTIVTSPPSTPQVQNIQPVQSFQTPPNPPNIQYILCTTCQQPTQSNPAPISSPVPLSTSTPLPTTSSAPSTLSTSPRTNHPPAPCVTNPPFVANATMRTYPFIRIRMFSSKGLPPIIRSTTVRTTTTRRPRRNRKNGYDACINACGGVRSPICAAPLATRPVDPNALRGFPSICHMACYNSFKRIQYEKLVDGRCGRLRTRIRPVDSRDKIRKDDLNKAQYQVISGSDPLTVIELGSKK